MPMEFAASQASELDVKAIGLTIADRNGTAGPRQGAPRDQYRRDVRDADGDGTIQEGTDWERSAPTRQQEKPSSRKRKRKGPAKRTVPILQAEPSQAKPAPRSQRPAAPRALERRQRPATSGQRNSPIRDRIRSLDGKPLPPKRALSLYREIEKNSQGADVNVKPRTPARSTQEIEQAKAERRLQRMRREINRLGSTPGGERAAGRQMQNIARFLQAAEAEDIRKRNVTVYEDGSGNATLPNGRKIVIPGYDQPKKRRRALAGLTDDQRGSIDQIDEQMKQRKKPTRPTDKKPTKTQVAKRPANKKPKNSTTAKPRKPAPLAADGLNGFATVDQRFTEMQQAVDRQFGSIKTAADAARAYKAAYPNAVNPLGFNELAGRAPNAPLTAADKGRSTGLLYAAMLNPSVAKQVTVLDVEGPNLTRSNPGRGRSIAFAQPNNDDFIFGMDFSRDRPLDAEQDLAKTAFKSGKGFKYAPSIPELQLDNPSHYMAAGFLYESLRYEASNNKQKAAEYRQKAQEFINSWVAVHEFTHIAHDVKIRDQYKAGIASGKPAGRDLWNSSTYDNLSPQEAQEAMQYLTSASTYAKANVMEAIAETGSADYFGMPTRQATMKRPASVDKWQRWLNMRTKAAEFEDAGALFLDDGSIILCTGADGKPGYNTPPIKVPSPAENDAELGSKSAQSTPARPSERISGSQQNAARSAASRSAASKIELTPELITALKRKVSEHNERVSGRAGESSRKATLPMLKAVLRRGMGAFSVSHRPNVSSRQQWGMARVNAFLRLLSSGRPSDPKYVSDNDLLPSGHPRASASKKALRFEEPVISVDVDIKALAARRRIRNVQYNPDAIDGDNDGIVQEGTPWERPAGARFLTDAGEEIAKYTSGSSFHPSMRLIDTDGEELEYRPISKPIAGSRRTRTFHTIGAANQTIGERYAVTRGRPARYRVSAPSRMRDRLSAETIARLQKMFRLGRVEQGERSRVQGSGMTLEESAKRTLRILEAASARDIELGRGWYAAQRKKIAAIAEKHGVSIELATGLVAAMSPRMAWDKYSKKLGRVITPNLDAADKLLENVASWRKERVKINARVRRRLKIPKTIADGEYAIEDLPVEQQAKFIRIRLEQSLDYKWPFMAKPVANALRIMDTGDVDAGLNGPKVRSFYDNLLNPDTSDAVTIDSIMAQLIGQMTAKQANAWLKLKGLGSEGQVRDRNGNLVADAGVYYALAEVVHLVAEQYNRGRREEDRLAVHDVQAILWYIQRERKTRLGNLGKAQKALTAKVNELQRARSAKRPNVERIRRLEAEAAERQRVLDDARTVTDVYDEF